MAKRNTIKRAQSRAVQHVTRGAFSQNPPLFEEHDMRGMTIDQIRLMRGHDDKPPFFGKQRKQPHKADLMTIIET